MKTNTHTREARNRTAGGLGAIASQISPREALRRSVLTCLMWEDIAYASGNEVAANIAALVPKVKAREVADLALEARQQMKLRHAPLFLIVQMLRYPEHRALVRELIPQVIRRADEVAELLSMYWAAKERPGKSTERKAIPAALKRGLADAFGKFNEYSLAKYRATGDVSLRDVLRLVRPKPVDQKQAELWGRLNENTLATPDTWEVKLSAAGSDPEAKRAAWEELLESGSLGAMALIRNLRNMVDAGVSENLIRRALGQVNAEWVLPYRFVAAAAQAPRFEDALEKLLLRSLEGLAKLPGRTLLVVDVSGSMQSGLSRRSQMKRLDAAASIAAIAREMCEEVVIYSTAGSDSKQTHLTRRLRPRRGFALIEQIKGELREMGGGGIFLVQCLKFIRTERKEQVDRVIVFTDEQDTDQKANPSGAPLLGKTNYIVNISSEKHGIAYNRFTHVNGWSEHVFTFIRELEASSGTKTPAQ